ncbi:MAG: phospho-sugar mutase [Anaerovoracaceae bacterium]
MNSYFEKYNSWKERKDLPKELMDELILLGNNHESIKEAFGSELKFGTSGLRGIMGAGTNRLNVPVIERVTQGFSNYINKRFDEKKVLISYDSRINSEIFAKKTAAVLAANGVEAYIFDELTPVSVLSFVIREMEMDFGIMITASHNPKEYNGYKVYNSKGGQILGKVAKDILEEIQCVAMFDEIKTVDFDSAIDNGINYVPKEITDKFIMKTLDCSFETEGIEKLKVVYTPLNGAGLFYAKKIILYLGVEHLNIVSEQEEPDGNFPFCPKPNPEYKEVYELGQKLMVSKNADIMIATDPDCDRIGVALPDMVLTGNQLGVLLFDYICRKLGDDAVDKTGVRSIVSTPLFDEIARNYGVNVDTTLIGFKYIGEKMEDLGDDFIFGFEEGNGYLGVRHMRDKDGLSSAMFACSMAAEYKAKRMDLKKALKNINKKYGYFEEKVINYRFEGIAGNQRREKIMEYLRGQIPKAIDQIDGVSITDYKVQKKYQYSAGVCEENSLPVANILEYDFGDGKKVIVRPSGTEPILKVYLFAKGKSKGQAQKEIEVMEAEITRIVNEEQ